MSSLFSLAFQQNCLGTANLHFHNKQTFPLQVPAPCYGSAQLFIGSFLTRISIGYFEFQPIMHAVRMTLIPSTSVVKLLSTILMKLPNRHFVRKMSAVKVVWVRFLGQIEATLPRRLVPFWKAPAGKCKLCYLRHV